MATDTRISGLPAIPSIVAADKIEVLDVSNTTNQATGENTVATMTQVAAAIAAINGSGGGSPFVGAGTGHAAGQVPDPGATVHATPYILGDDGSFHPISGSALSYSGGGYVVTAGTGGGATPGGTPGQVQVNSAGAFGGADLTALLDTLVGSPAQGSIFFRDSAAWNDLAPGTSGQFLKTQGAGANPVWSAAAGAATLRVFGITSFGQTATGTTPMSLFTGGSPGFAVNGSLSIPANTLQAGSQIEMGFAGGAKFNAPDTMTMSILIGGVLVMTGTTAALAAVTTESEWYLKDCFISVHSVTGTTASIRGGATLAAAAASSAVGTATILMSLPGNGGVSGAVTVNPTIALPIDLQVSFSSANAANLVRVFRGYAKVLL